MTKFEPVIGLEVHVQIKTLSKLFCACPTTFGAAPNANVCPICIGSPGVLPTLNRKAVEGLVKAGLALHCRINPHSIFARKQYFYPDLPKGYQISQYELPLAEKGFLEIPSTLDPSGKKKIGITRIHLEEDAGKLLHAIGSTELPYSLVDLNRTSVPLMEIVSEPDIRSSDEAVAYLNALKSAIQYLDVSDCDMEKGSLRCDANVSVRPAGQEKFGQRTEIKNMNSFANLKDAVEHEIARQIEVIEGGGRIVMETRLWDTKLQETRPMRSKEEAHDYRYFPEPDLVPLALDEAFLEPIRKNLPELADARRARLVSQYGLSEYDAGVLTAEKAIADYFESATNPFKQDKEASKKTCNWLSTELLGRLNAEKKTIEECPVSPQALGELVQLIHSGKISGKAGKDVFIAVWEGEGMPAAIVEKKGLLQVSDDSALEKWVEEGVAANPKIVADFKAGNDRALGAIVGWVMKQSKGKANPQKINELLKNKLT